MKQIIFLMFLLVGLPTSAQKINKDYLFYTQEKGILCYIFPQKGFISPDKSDKKGLEYDITYLTANDSLVFSYTYINQDICKPTTVTFLSSEKEVLHSGEAQTLFVQPHKNNWIHRGTVKVPYCKAVSFYNQTFPFLLQIHTNKKDITYQINKGKWEKQSLLISRIFETIKNNS